MTLLNQLFLVNQKLYSDSWTNDSFKPALFSESETVVRFMTNDSFKPALLVNQKLYSDSWTNDSSKPALFSESETVVRFMNKWLF